MGKSIPAVLEAAILGATALCIVGIAPDQRAACQRIDAKAAQHVLSLLRGGQLSESNTAITRLGSPDCPEISDLWAKYHLKVVMSRPLSQDSVDEVRAIPPNHAEYTIAQDYIRKNIEFRVRALDGDPVRLSQSVTTAYDALWRGDGGRAVEVLVSLLHADKCLRNEEWPCVQTEVVALTRLGERTEADNIRERATSRLREHARAAVPCRANCDACIEHAIQAWVRWEDFTHQTAPELIALRATRANVNAASRPRRRGRADRCD